MAISNSEKGDIMKIKKQRDYRDCGITCLAYIIEYYKGYVPIETLRIDTYTNQFGCSAYHLVETLKKYGFQAFGKKVSFEELKNVIKPAILHVTLENGLEHFVVLLNIKNDVIHIMDPALGNRKIVKKDFLHIWKGIVLEAVPIKKVVKMTRKNIWSTFFKEWLVKYWKVVIFIVLIQLLSMAGHIVISYYVVFMNEVDSFYWLFICFGILLLFMLFINFLDGWTRIKIESDISLASLKKYVMHMYNIPLNNYMSYSEGEILTRLEEVKEIKKVLFSVLIPALIQLLLSMVAFFMLFYLNQKMGLILILGMFFYFILALINGKRVYQIVMKTIDEEVNWKEKMLDSIKILPASKYLSSYDYYKKKVFLSIKNNIEVKKKEEKKFFLIEWVRSSYLEILFFLLISFGMWSIRFGNMSIIDFVVFQGLYLYLVTPLREVADLIPRYFYYKQILEKINDFWEIREDDNSGSKKIIDGSIKLLDVSFAYQGIYPVLNGVNLNILSGEHVYLHGTSGIGKSTLCKLLAKEYCEYQGDIYIGRNNINDYGVNYLRLNVTYLAQNESIITGSIKDNILFGRNISKDLFSLVCHICHVDELVQRKKFGYETIVNREIVSGGERQRIILARTLLKKSKIYLFDECLSEVDMATSLDIIKGIHSYLKGKTVIFVTHKNYPLKLDRTVSLKGGDLIAQ